jgi:hypothetical protein
MRKILAESKGSLASHFGPERRGVERHFFASTVAVAREVLPPDYADTRCLALRGARQTFIVPSIRDHDRVAQIRGIPTVRCKAESGIEPRLAVRIFQLCRRMSQVRLKLPVVAQRGRRIAQVEREARRAASDRQLTVPDRTGRSHRKRRTDLSTV